MKTPYVFPSASASWRPNWIVSSVFASSFRPKMWFRLLFRFRFCLQAHPNVLPHLFYNARVSDVNLSECIRTHSSLLCYIFLKNTGTSQYVVSSAFFQCFLLFCKSGLLIILSQGSDPLSMNDHYEKVFDAISTVHHNKNDKQVNRHLKTVRFQNRQFIGRRAAHRAKGG